MNRLAKTLCAAASGILLLTGPSAATQATDNRPKVAILLFDGVEIIDYTGPFEVFGKDGFDVFTVAARKSPVTTAMGMSVVPKYSFADAPRADVLVVPGGNVSEVADDAATLAWIKATAHRAGHTLSVCNGAITLANTGLLDGLSATTTSFNIDFLRRQHPAIRVVRDQRVVDNGSIVTTGGLSAGIDGALHLVSKLRGEGEARSVALRLEYDWRTDGGFLPATFALREIPEAGIGGELGTLGHWTVVSTIGDRNRWDLVKRVESTLTPAELASRLGEIYASAGRWTAASNNKGEQTFTFVDADGLAWNAKIDVSVERTAGEYRVHVGVARSNA